MLDTKVAILVLEELAFWQTPNVTALPAVGIAGVAPETMGKPHADAAGCASAGLVGQPTLSPRRAPGGSTRPVLGNGARPDPRRPCAGDARDRPRRLQPHFPTSRTRGVPEPERLVLRGPEGTTDRATKRLSPRR